ncbi:UNVERIFIED_CONTAM: hypothetical protein Scaly_2936400 [Sesamum calycinum]|uniref:Reverse transcriptase Ty1/copia-type domain-containing protein n=1 Tax=Sesamum calycinum TaxID=2727403 RepID=A0AAW2KTR1_9LAMI
MDVNNAFLHEHLDDEVYMTPLKGYSVPTPRHICRLKCSLYGLKQTSCQWNIELSGRLQAYGFLQCTHDHCLFIHSTFDSFTALLVYVDDILLTSDSDTELQAVKVHLDVLFTIKDLGQAKYFMGLEMARSAHSLLVTQ